MINITKHPDKIITAVNPPAKSGFYIVVDIKTGRPQHFSVHSHRKESLGEFYDANTTTPTGIYDWETALYLIGQNAISAMLDVVEAVNEDNCVSEYVDYQQSLIIIPAAGSCLPFSSPSIPEL